MEQNTNEQSYLKAIVAAGETQAIARKKWENQFIKSLTYADFLANDWFVVAEPPVMTETPAAPVETALVVETPSVETPVVEVTPVTETPVTEPATVIETPAPVAEVETPAPVVEVQAVVTETPTPAETPIETTPVDDTSLETTPVDDTSLETTPVDDTSLAPVEPSLDEKIETEMNRIFSLLEGDSASNSWKQMVKEVVEKIDATLKSGEITDTDKASALKELQSWR